MGDERVLPLEKEWVVLRSKKTRKFLVGSYTSPPDNFLVFGEGNTEEEALSSLGENHGKDSPLYLMKF
jgi:hypothetical protein